MGAEKFSMARLMDVSKQEVIYVNSITICNEKG